MAYGGVERFCPLLLVFTRDQQGANIEPSMRGRVGGSGALFECRNCQR